jgi:hypothetical protein
MNDHSPLVRVGKPGGLGRNSHVKKQQNPEGMKKVRSDLHYLAPRRLDGGVD